VLRIHLSSNVSGAGFKALSKLLQLREFLFGENMEKWELEQKCVMWSVKLIPQLSLVGRRYDVSNFDSNAQLFKYHNAVTRLRRPIELGLEELVLNGTVRLSLNVRLCKVRAVHWYMPDGGDVLGKFLISFW